MAGIPSGEEVATRGEHHIVVAPMSGAGDRGIEAADVLGVRGAFQGGWSATAFAGDQIDGTCQRIRAIIHAEWTLHHLHAVDARKVDLGQVDVPVLSADHGYSINEQLHVLAAQTLHAH